MRLVIVSDTHCQHDNVPIPDGDVFVHAGDLCNFGRMPEVKAFGKWLARLPHRHKIVIAGNHDWPFARHRSIAVERLGASVSYLQDSGVTIDGVRFWGSPWQPAFNNWAFNLPRSGPELAQKWALIPADTDVLITHGPPMGILDQIAGGEHLGCSDLTQGLGKLSRMRVHIFGHILEAAGIKMRGERTFVNACICDGDYRPVNPARVIDL